MNAAGSVLSITKRLVAPRRPREARDRRVPTWLLRALCAVSGRLWVVMLLLAGLTAPHARAQAAEAQGNAATAPEERAVEQGPVTHALLLNGGGSAASNYLSHLHHLQDMTSALRSRGIPAERIHVFTSDGSEPAPDLSARGSELPGFWLVDSTPTGRALNSPELTNTVWEGVPLHPARRKDLRRWFSDMSDVLRPGDTLLVFVTDHGTKNADDPDNGFISLWNESLSVLEFRAMLGYLQPGVRVVNVMSQCYSGAFADAMTPLNSRVPDGDVCGFYSTTRDRPAYGCYPEGRDRDRIGHAFGFIDAMGRHAALGDVQTAVLITDVTPDVPVRTSDLFLERVLQDEAGRRKIEMEKVVDEQLALAWKDRARWEPQIRLLDRIGQVYGTSSPRTMAELRPAIDSLQSLSNELDTYQERWKLALDDLRRDNLARFLEANAPWKQRLDDKTIATLDAAGRRQTLADVLPPLEEFTKGRADVWARLQDLRAKEDDAGNAQYRADIRLAALLRMRSLLIRVAGTQFVRGGGAATTDTPSGKTGQEKLRLALTALETCEASRIGTFDSGAEKPPIQEAPPPLAPLEEDLAAVRRALPSWLGVRFRPVPDKQRERLGVDKGAVIVDQIFEDGPAGAAGIRNGDVILGPPGGHFTETNQLREWTMTSPRSTPLALEVQRDGESFRATVHLVPYPTKLPALPSPPKVGDDAPQLGSLTMVRTDTSVVDLSRRRHMIFFWATWCQPCKKSIPELLAWSRKTGVPVLAVSDEDADIVRSFLGSWTAPFPALVATDDLRRPQQSYGVSGTPTFVLVDERGKIEWRQVGYSATEKLAIPGWSWSGSGE